MINIERILPFFEYVFVCVCLHIICVMCLINFWKGIPHIISKPCHVMSRHVSCPSLVCVGKENRFYVCNLIWLIKEKLNNKKEGNKYN